MIMPDTILETKIPGQQPTRGKVRDIYDLGDRLLIVATDRISAFDVVMANGIPNKGVILTRISKFWFDFLTPDIEHHLITTQVDKFPEPFCNHPDQLTARSMLVKKVETLPVECVVRSYLAGSGWKEYKKSQTVCGIELPSGLKQCDKLPELIFTPATKAEQGMHDENISFARAAEILGHGRAKYVRDKSIEIFKKASEYAESKGIILADTKFEWGIFVRTRCYFATRYCPENQRKIHRGIRTTHCQKIPTCGRLVCYFLRSFPVTKNSSVRPL